MTRKRTILVLVILLLLAACSSQDATPLSSPAAPSQQANLTQSPPEPELQAEAWVNDPNPPLNTRIVLRGSLIKYGHYYLGGMMMSAYWPDETNERGTPNCTSLVTYGAGKCVIDISRFPPGKFVPVTVSFEYGGQTYTARTGFTPQSP